MTASLQLTVTLNNVQLATIPSGRLTIIYVYDPLKRLTEANYSNGDYYHYTYDATGNRKTQTTNIGVLISTITP